MSGVRVIVGLLVSYAAGSPTVVERSRIKPGDIPIGTPLPAISVTHVSSVRRLTLAMNEAHPMFTDRVQVTVLAKDQQGNPQGGGYSSLSSIMAWILEACPNQHGTVNGVNVDSIIPAVEGPDLPIPEQQILTRSRDFIVKYVA